MKKIINVRKISDVGTSEPWSARMWLGILEIRNHVFENGNSGPNKRKEEFDKVYTPLLNNLSDAFTNLTEIENLIVSHEKDVKEGKVLSVSGNQYTVEKPIDQKIKILFRGFINALTTALKSTQYICKAINDKFDVGFLFTSDQNFEKCIKKIEKNKGPLLDHLEMMKNFRHLSNEIVTMTRNPIEHPMGNFSLPDIEYDFENLQIKNNFYTQNKLRRYWENSWRFCELILVAAFETQIKKPWGIVYIPKDQREPSIPIKYKVWVVDEVIVERISNHISHQKNRRQHLKNNGKEMYE